MSLPKNYLVDATLERLGQSFIDLYNTKIGDDVRESLALIFYEEFIEPQTGRQRNLKEIRTHYYRDKFKRTKKNWYSALVKSVGKVPKNPKELMAEIKYIEDGIDKGFIVLKDNYNVSTMEELIQARLKEIDEWVNDDSKLLSEYRYIKDKTNLQIQNTLKFDSVMTVTNLVIAEYGGEFNAMVKEVSDIIGELPLPGKNGTAQFRNLPDVTEGETAVTVEEYNQEGLSIKTLLGSKMLEDKSMFSITKRDYHIFNYVLSKRDFEFVERQKIFVDIGEIVKNVYSSKGVKEYNAVRDRLEKLKHISFDITDEQGRKYIFDLFDHVTYLDEAKTKAEIKINEFMHQRYINNHVIRIYSDKIQNFSLPVSENIVTILQKERFQHLSTTDEQEEDAFFMYPYHFFARRLRLPAKKSEGISMVEQSLEEIIKNQVTVKSYKRSGEIFHICFFPVSTHEAEDLIESNPSKPIFQLEATVE